MQHAKKVHVTVVDTPWLVDYSTRLVNSVLNLPNAYGQVKFFGDFKVIDQLQSILLLINFFQAGTCLSDSSPKWQAVKLIFFAPRR